MFGNGTLICIGFNRAKVFVFSPEMTPQARMVPDVNTNLTVSVYYNFRRRYGRTVRFLRGFCGRLAISALVNYLILKDSD